VPHVTMLMQQQPAAGEPRMHTQQPCSSPNHAFLLGGRPWPRLHPRQAGRCAPCRLGQQHAGPRVERHQGHRAVTGRAAQRIRIAPPNPKQGRPQLPAAPGCPFAAAAAAAACFLVNSLSRSSVTTLALRGGKAGGQARGAPRHASPQRGPAHRRGQGAHLPRSCGGSRAAPPPALAPPAVAPAPCLGALACCCAAARPWPVTAPSGRLPPLPGALRGGERRGRSRSAQAELASQARQQQAGLRPPTLLARRGWAGRRGPGRRGWAAPPRRRAAALWGPGPAAPVEALRRFAAAAAAAAAGSAIHRCRRCTPLKGPSRAKRGCSGPRGRRDRTLERSLCIRGGRRAAICAAGAMNGECSFLQARRSLFDRSLGRRLRRLVGDGTATTSGGGELVFRRACIPEAWENHAPQPRDKPAACLLACLQLACLLAWSLPARPSGPTHRDCKHLAPRGILHRRLPQRHIRLRCCAAPCRPSPAAAAAGA
jgi:hypothetical protein